MADDKKKASGGSTPGQMLMALLGFGLVGLVIWLIFTGGWVIPGLNQDRDEEPGGVRRAPLLSWHAPDPIPFAAMPPMRPFVGAARPLATQLDGLTPQLDGTPEPGPGTMYRPID